MQKAIIKRPKKTARQRIQTLLAKLKRRAGITNKEMEKEMKNYEYKRTRAKIRELHKKLVQGSLKKSNYYPKLFDLRNEELRSFSRMIKSPVKIEDKNLIFNPRLELAKIESIEKIDEKMKEEEHRLKILLEQNAISNKQYLDLAEELHSAVKEKLKQIS